MKILAFGASNSSKSINRRLAYWASHKIEGAEVTFIDLNDFEMPIYSPDREKSDGVPDPAHTFKQLIRESDGIVISFAEYNGSYTAAFKNIFDWMSRLEKPIWMNKPMFLLSTSPGQRGALGVLSDALEKFPYQGAVVAGSFSLPFFADNFTDEDGITNEDLLLRFEEQLTAFETALAKAKIPQEA